MKKFLPLILLVFLFGATALWYFGHHQPTQKMLNAKPTKIYKTTTPIRPNRQPVMQENSGGTTLEHGTENETESPMENKNEVIVTTADSTDSRPSDTVDHSEHMGGDEDTQTTSEQEVSEHEHSHEHEESDSSKELLEEARVALEEGAKLQKEAHLFVANQLNGLSVEQQSALLEQMKRAFINAKNPQTGDPTFDNREQALSHWQKLLDGLHEAGYTPPAGFE